MNGSGDSQLRPPLALAVTVEEWHQDARLSATLMRSQRERLPSLAEEHVAAWLQLLARLSVRATFFVDRSVLERLPSVVETIARAGHELRAGSVEETLAVLSAEGRRCRCVHGEEFRRGARIPGTVDEDVAHFRSWEIDATQPRITSASRSARRSHYEGLERTSGLVAQLRDARGLAPFVEALQLAPLPLQAPESGGDADCAHAPRRAVSASNADARAVSVVVPMFDEEDNVAFLLRSLDALREAGGDAFAFEFVLVDDCSRDATWSTLQKLCANRADIRLVRHETTRGVAAAIRTGCLEASNECVASIDCDGSYDPLELLAMAPLLDGADLVTASPYHREGRVANVPSWRLLLSRGLSLLYRIALRRRIATWTSCCRVTRKSLVAELPLERGGFLGIAEQLARVVRRGGVVVEHPATLSSRILGFSKMKTLRTIGGHLALLGNVVCGRVR